MLAFLAQSWGTLLIGALVLLVVVLVIRKLLHDRKQGKSSCGCNCAHCPNAGMCHSHTVPDATPASKKIK